MKLTYMTLSGCGDAGKTTIARHCIAPERGGRILTFESRAARGDESDLLDREGLVAHLFADAADGAVIDVGVGDALDALDALQLIGRQDTGLSERLRIVVPLLGDRKSAQGLAWLLGKLPPKLRSAIRAVWNRIPAGGEDALRASDPCRAVRGLEKQHRFRLLTIPLFESALLNPAHPLLAARGSLEAIASIPDSEIRGAPLSEMPILIAARDQAQLARSNCQQALVAIDE